MIGKPGNPVTTPAQGGAQHSLESALLIAESEGTQVRCAPLRGEGLFLSFVVVPERA